MVIGGSSARAHCGEPAGHGPEPSGSRGFELELRSQVDGFAVTPLEIISTERGLLGRFVVQKSVDTENANHLRLFDPDGRVTYSHDEPFDAFSGRVSAPSGDTVFVTETVDVVDDVFAHVQVRQLSLEDGQRRDFVVLPELVLSLPSRDALVEVGGRIWCLATNASFMLTLYGLSRDAVPSSTPIVELRVASDGSRIVRYEGGFVVAVVAGAGSERQVELRFFDEAGHSVHAGRSEFPVAARLGAVRASGPRVFVAGTLVHRSNDESLFVQVWNGGSLERTITFDVGDDQASIRDIEALSDEDMLVAGEFGTRQADTGSILEGGSAFFARFSSAGVENLITIGNADRRNALAAFGRQAGRRFVFAHQDFPKTHDADDHPEQAYGRAMLYELIEKTRTTGP